ncbi:MAG: polymerase III gamma/tau subunit DnaX2 protein [Parcubacteria group bacterium GW2011_GWD2_38_11]|nr:MAG: polymerase III gamma/tau subunit DnaX2 protein [Parcubacteria group bacterium GW2011_GWD2_38_11]
MDFIGNKKAADILQRSIQNKTLGHAYLFSGPEKVGKFTLAKMFALSAISSGKLNLDIDNVDRDAMLDLVIVQPEITEKNGISKQRDISIESIRDAKLSLSLFPYHGKYKVLIIDDAHRMTNGCQNALLKILEEPNPTTILILVTNEIDRILPTILSRLQVVNFGLVDDEDIKIGFAENFSFQKDCVELSIGRPGLAQYLSEHNDERLFRTNALVELEKIRKGTLNEKFKLAEDLSKDAVRTLDKLNVWLWEIRKIAIGVDQVESNRACAIIEKIQKAMTVLKRTNANSRLILETLFMDM